MMPLILLAAVVPMTDQADAVSEELLDVLALVESNSMADAVGDGGRSVGAFQIQEAMVAEANRIMYLRYGRGIRVVPFTAADRLNPARSRLVARIFLVHWSSRMARKHRHAMTEQDLISLWRWGSTRWRPKCVDHPVDKARWEKACKYLHNRHEDGIMQP